MNEDILNSQSMLSRNKNILSKNIIDNNKRVREKLSEVLVSMDTYRKFDFKNKKLPFINDEYIEKKVGNIKRTMNGVFDDYVRNMIIHTVNVAVTPENHQRVFGADPPAQEGPERPVYTQREQVHQGHREEAGRLQKVLHERAEGLPEATEQSRNRQGHFGGRGEEVHAPNPSERLIEKCEEQMDAHEKERNEFLVAQSKLKRQLEEKQRNNDLCIQKLNFFRANMNQSLEKDRKLLDSVVQMKNRQAMFAEMIGQLKEVRN